MKKSTIFYWDWKEQEAFDKIQSIMCSAPVLQQPNFKKKFYLQTDTLVYGVGAILLQEGEIT
jgi:hypothetical protein